MPESRVHGHNQYLVDVLHDFFENRRRSRRVNGDADAFSQRSDALHGAGQIVVALPVNQKRIGSRLREFFDKEIGIGNHQMRLQRQARHSSQRFDDRRAHGKIWHEMSVHDVHMNAVRSSTLGLGHLFAQAGKIGREDRWSELDCLGRHIAPLSLR